ncbi:MAG TPA: O-antigen ligase family protein [Gaiellaceae bacterium]|nr:O-antigen ligase family protein [Gaiellaceae bacterium]
MNLTVQRPGVAFAPPPAMLGTTLAATTVVAFAASQGGFFASSWRVGSVVLGAFSFLLLLWTPARRTRATVALFALLVTYLALSLASVAWSADPSASLLDAQRTVLYVVGLAGFALAGEGLGVGVALGAGIVGAWALVDRVVAGTHWDTYEGTLLTGPIGYANGLGALAAIAIAVCVGLAFEHRNARYALPLLVLVPTLVLTNSRAGMLAAVLGCAVAAALRWRQRAVAAILVVGAAAVLAIVFVDTPSFLGDRASYWDAARATVAAHPFGGSGAGTFGVVHVQAPYARDAHSLYLQAFSEVGVLGLVLTLALLAFPLAVALRRGLIAPAAGLAVFAVHAGVDWDWQLPAVTLAALALAVDATRKRSVKSDYPLV